ncbi:MAG TPA: FGGY family carbohydrate kinase [Thermomicrobiales bacterium]|nr:FGGY family carbohydrate kinase [Thermomicrobiales bacterium]
MTLLLGLDVGTTSVKAVVYHTDGIAVAASSLPTPTHVPRPGWAFYRPDELWETVVAAIRGALADVPQPEQIASVAVASVGESGVLLDAAGAATTDSIAWFDSRTRPQAAWLAERIGKDVLFARSGLSLQHIFSLNKLLWHREHEPAAWAQSVRWLMLADFIAYRLCGETATDYSLASRTLMLDLHQKCWHEETLDEAGIDRGLLAALVSAGTPLERITSGAAALTGLPPTAVVTAGGHDHVCGAFAAGVTRPGQMLNSLGTAEAVFLPIEQPLVDPKAGSQGYTQGAHVVGGGYYAFGSNYTSGASIEWLRDLLGASDDRVAHAELIASAERVPAGSLGVLFLPHLRLANPPYDDPRSRGALIGLTMDAGRDVITRAVFEGLALESRNTLEPLLAYPQVTAPRSVVAIGGGTRNPLLMRVKASVSHLNHHIVSAEEATALGAALLGGLGAGVYRDADDAVAAMRYGQHEITPELSDVLVYEKIYTEVYRRLYPSIAPLSQAISDLQPTAAVSRDHE